MLMNLMPLLAYDRHGRDYSVRDGGGSGFLGFIIFVVIIIYVVVSSKKDDQ